MAAPGPALSRLRRLSDNEKGPNFTAEKTARWATWAFGLEAWNFGTRDSMGIIKIMMGFPIHGNNGPMEFPWHSGIRIPRGFDLFDSERSQFLESIYPISDDLGHLRSPEGGRKAGFKGKKVGEHIIDKIEHKLKGHLNNPRRKEKRGSI